MKQRGFSGIEIIGALLAAAALVAAIAGLVHLVTSYLDGIRTTADRAGYDRALKETAQRDKTELIDAQGQIAALTADRDQQAAAHAEEQARLKRIHDKEVAGEKTKTADLQHRIDTGELVLRDPGRRAGEGCAEPVNQVRDSGRVESGTAAAPADGSGQVVGAGLSPEAARFLLGEADRADEVAADLELCWGIARDDRVRSAVKSD